MGAIGTDKKKRLFVEAYDAENPAIAMRLAGYSGTDSYLKSKAKSFLEDPNIVNAIEERNRYLESTDKVIATRTERQAFWTALMRNDTDGLNIKPEYDSNGLPKKMDNLPLAQRIKASELLGKSETDFVDRLDINHNVTITEIIQQSYLDDGKSIESIEAEYTKLQKELDEADNSADADSTESVPSLESFL